MIGSTTHGFVESEFAQLIALFAAWRQEIDSEPFAHESDWATVDAPAFREVSTWGPRVSDEGVGEPQVDPFV